MNKLENAIRTDYHNRMLLARNEWAESEECDAHYENLASMAMWSAPRLTDEEYNTKVAVTREPARNRLSEIAAKHSLTLEELW